MIRVPILVILLTACLFSEITSLTWRNCDPSANFQFTNFGLDPIVLDVNRPTKLTVSGTLQRPISSMMNGTFNIVKIMKNTNLSVRCYPNEQGVDIGSCTNVDICTSFMALLNASEQNCPQSLKDNGIDCKCPMQLDRGMIDFQVPIVVYPNAVAESWFFGDLAIQIQVVESGTSLFCLDLDLEVKTQ